jgi:spore coat polysaccharide biosynthesis protein SpsF
MNITAILQARMTSTRLPGKVLMDVQGEPLLARVVERAQKATRLTQIIVATTTRVTDDDIAAWCQGQGLACFRGSENDVLDRFYHAAREFAADVVVRLTADCPLLDAQVVDAVIGAFHSGKYDYVSNTLELSYPDGLDTEVFSFDALERAWSQAELPSEREHVTPYIWKHPAQFRLGSVRNLVNLSHLRWTVDDARDLEFVRRVYEYFGAQTFFMNDVVAALQLHPEWLELNAGLERNEGYAKSLREDSEVKQLR